MGLRRGALEAFLIWGLGVWALTEALSALKLLTPAGAAAAWILAVIASGLLWVRQERRWQPFGQLLGFARRNPLPAATVAAICAVTFVIALAAPPNTWDSMTTYMARVGNWVQNRSVEHYPTTRTQQLFAPPLAQYAILHFQLLAGGDRFANLVQWLSMIGALFGVAAVAKELGSSERAAALAVLFAATVPMGILQATSTQTDYAVTLYLVIFAWLCLRNLSRPTWATYALEGVALGLAAMTKATALFVVMPFLLWQAGWALWRWRLRALAGGAIVVACVLALNALHFARNLRTFDYPLGDPADIKSFNTRFGVRVTLSGLLRGAALHLGTTARANQAVVGAITAMHEAAGLDATDPATTFGGRFNIHPFNTHEDLTGNPAHFVLALAALPAVFLLSRLRRNRRLVGYVLAWLAGVVILCACVRWSPWRQRFHLPWFALFGPVVAAVAVSMPRRWPATALSVLLAVGSLPWLVCNASRPLVHWPALTRGTRVFGSDRLDQYFVNRDFYGQRFKDQYVAMLAVLKRLGCRTIGLHRGREAWEYPLWVLARRNLRDVRIVQPLAANAIAEQRKAKVDVWVYLELDPRTIESARRNPDLGRQVLRAPHVLMFLPRRYGAAGR